MSAELQNKEEAVMTTIHAGPRPRVLPLLAALTRTPAQARAEFMAAQQKAAAERSAQPAAPASA